MARGDARTQISQKRDLQKRVYLAERQKAQGYLKHGWELWAQWCELVCMTLQGLPAEILITREVGSGSGSLRSG